MNEDRDSDPLVQLQLTALKIALGVSPVKAMHQYDMKLKEFGRQGALPLEELSRLLSEVKGWSEEYAGGWGTGYAEGWAAATLRILEQREVEVSDEAHWYITTRTDLKTLARWLDMSATATRWEDLVTAERNGFPSPTP